jgi:exopolysaccharide production protein ExoQ
MTNFPVSSDQSVMRLVVVWVLMVPLFYFASAGGLWFQTVKTNDSFSISYESILASSSSNTNLAIVASLLTVALLPVLFRIKSVIRSCGRDGLFALLVGVATASCLWSQFPTKSLVSSLYLAVDTLFAFYLYRRFRPAELMKILYLLGWICLAFSIVLALCCPLYGISHSDAMGAWRGMYPHKNLCAPMTAYFLSVGFYLPMAGFLSRSCRVAYVVLSIVLIGMSQSRAGWIMLAFIFVYVVAVQITQKIGRTDRLVVLLLGTMISFGWLSFVLSNLRGITYLLGKDPTLTGRTEIWNATMNSAMKRPMLGYGYMGFWRGFQGEAVNASLAKGGVLTGAHNGFLNIWLTLGAVGLVLVLYTFIRALRDGVSCLRNGKSSYLSWCLCIVLLTILHSMDETQAMVPNDLTWILYILACVGLSEGARHFRLGRDHG